MLFSIIIIQDVARSTRRKPKSQWLAKQGEPDGTYLVAPVATNRFSWFSSQEVFIVFWDTTYHGMSKLYCTR